MATLMRSPRSLHGSSETRPTSGKPSPLLRDGEVARRRLRRLNTKVLGKFGEHSEKNSKFQLLSGWACCQTHSKRTWETFDGAAGRQQSLFHRLVNGDEVNVWRPSVEFLPWSRIFLHRERASNVGGKLRFAAQRPRAGEMSKEILLFPLLSCPT